MNKKVAQIISVIKDNELICADTNIRDLQKQFLKIEPSFWKYDRLYSRLRKSDRTIFYAGEKEYHIQVLKTQ